MSTINITNARKDLYNLVENAIKYNHSGGKVTVKISQKKDLPAAHSKPADYALVEVTDTGIGISPEYQEKIFAPFFRQCKHIFHRTVTEC